MASIPQDSAPPPPESPEVVRRRVEYLRIRLAEMQAVEQHFSPYSTYLGPEIQKIERELASLARPQALPRTSEKAPPKPDERQLRIHAVHMANPKVRGIAWCRLLKAAGIAPKQRGAWEGAGKDYPATWALDTAKDCAGRKAKWHRKVNHERSYTVAKVEDWLKWQGENPDQSPIG
jgi:hypothetical protein